MSDTDAVTTIISSAFIVYGPYGQVYTTDSIEGQYDVLGTGYVHSTDSPSTTTSTTSTTSSTSFVPSSTTTSSSSSTSTTSSSTSSDPWTSYTTSSTYSSSSYVYVESTSTSTSTTSTDSLTSTSSWPSSTSTTTTSSSWLDTTPTTSSTDSTSTTTDSTPTTTTSTSSELTTSTESSTTTTTSSDASSWSSSSTDSTTSEVDSTTTTTSTTTSDTDSSSTTYASTTTSSDTYVETSSDLSSFTSSDSAPSTSTETPSSTSSALPVLATTAGPTVENASQEKQSSGLTSSQSKIVVAAVTPAAFVCVSLVLALCIFFWRKRRTRGRLQRQSSLDKNNGSMDPFYSIPMPPASSFPPTHGKGEFQPNEKKGSTPHSLSIVPVDAESDGLSLLSPDDFSPQAGLISGARNKGHDRKHSSISMTAKRVSGILKQQFSSDDDNIQARAQGTFVHLQPQVSSSETPLPFKPSGGKIVAAELAGASILGGQKEKPILTPVSEKQPSSAFFADPPSPIHRVEFEYNATMSDELSIRPGQFVQIRHEFDDGWCNADLLDNYSKIMIANGIVPKACLSETPIVFPTNNNTAGSRGLQQQQQQPSSSTSPRTHYTPSIPQGFSKNNSPEDVGRAV